MRDAEFKDWLIARGLADNSMATRLSAVRRIERVLPELGVSQPDLDAAYDTDTLDAVRASLVELRADAKQGGEAYRVLLPESGAPVGRLDNFIAWLGNYREFRESVGSTSSQADRIRVHVVQHYLVPARSKGATTVVVVAGDVHRAMKLQNAMPAVCSALDSRKFSELASITLTGREGPANSSTVRFTFDLNPMGANWAESELRRRYGMPIAETDKMVAFALPDQRQIALQRDVKAVQIWLEDDVTSEAAPAPQVRHYLPDQARHSNLPTRLKHLPPGGHAARRVSLVSTPNHGLLSRVLDWYEALSMSLNKNMLEALRRTFAEQFPDFVDFATSGKYYKAEDDYKRPLIAAAQELLERQPRLEDDALGRKLLDLISNRSVNLLGNYRTYDHLDAIRAANPGVFEIAAGALARDTDSHPTAIERHLAITWPIISAGQAASMPYGDSRIFPTLLLSLVRPRSGIFVRTRPFQNAGVMLLGRAPFANAPLSAAEYSNILAMSEAIFTVMRDEWNWKPRDLWDVQGFIWVTCQKRIAAISNHDASDLAAKGRAVQPTNLILYGPPGTGKTFSTAREAVALCDGQAADDRTKEGRAALMERYRALLASGRIEFVTFHQSYSYEDFVEGLRPTTDNLDETSTSGESELSAKSSAGFRLQSEDGVFKLISDRARLDRGAEQASPMLDRNRPIFKIALGRRGEQEAQIEEGLDQGLIHLGWGGTIDWSDERFDSFEEIRKFWREQEDAEASGKDPNIEMMYTFRAAMQPGDYVMLSDGRDTVRAFGKIAGEYYFDKTVGFHPHRRKVEWIWKDRDGISRDAFYPNFFRRHSTYQLKSALVEWDALEEVVLGTRSIAPTREATPYVLVIDEINRANISKVFGELITLIEPDKRLGETNALSVRLPYSKRLFGVPANLHIVGTMNTADRSIALLDTALRRRFTFRELMPDPGLLADQLDGVSLARMLATINERIEYLFDREHQIGHAYFLDCEDKHSIDDVMRFRVIPLLAEYFYEDWGKVAAVLGDSGNGEGTREGAFLDRKQLTAPTGFDGEESAPRYRWTVRSREQGFSYAAFA